MAVNLHLHKVCVAESTNSDANNLSVWGFVACNGTGVQDFWKCRSPPFWASCPRFDSRSSSDRCSGEARATKKGESRLGQELEVDKRHNEEILGQVGVKMEQKMKRAQAG